MNNKISSINNTIGLSICIVSRRVVVMEALGTALLVCEMNGEREAKDITIGKGSFVVGDMVLSSTLCAASLFIVFSFLY